jgi:hypothetical protein
LVICGRRAIIRNAMDEEKIYMKDYKEHIDFQIKFLDSTLLQKNKDTNLKKAVISHLNDYY